MLPSRVGSALVAGTLLLAGCAGFAAESTPSPTVTPVDVQPEPRQTVGGPLPPGVDESGVSEPVALALAHHERLADRPYAMRSVLTIRYANGTLRGRLDTRVRVGPDGRLLVEAVSRGPHPPFRPAGDRLVRTPGRSAFWSDGERLLWLTEQGGTVSYHQVPADEYDPETWRQLATPVTRQELQLTFNAVETTVAGRERRNGTEFVVLRSTGRTKPGSAGKALSAGAAFQYPLGVETGYISSVSLRALVDADGAVHRHRFAYTARVDGTRVRVRRRVSYTGFGATTVERPDWYDEAVAATATASARPENISSRPREAPV